MSSKAPSATTFSLTRVLFVVTSLLLSTATLAADLETDRAKTRKMRDAVLQKLYIERPRVREEIQQAAGYAVFSNVGVNVVFFAASAGNGISHNNRSGREMFMNMASAGVGLGIGVKDFRAVIVFHTRQAYQNFIAYGWDFSGQADATAKSTDKGEGSSTAVTAVRDVSVYQLTEVGLALQATLQGSKYWHSSRLN